jgi:hypothetical protein
MYEYFALTGVTIKLMPIGNVTGPDGESLNARPEHAPMETWVDMSTCK